MYKYIVYTMHLFSSYSLIVYSLLVLLPVLVLPILLLPVLLLPILLLLVLVLSVCFLVFILLAGVVLEKYRCRNGSKQTILLLFVFCRREGTMDKMQMEDLFSPGFKWKIRGNMVRNSLQTPGLKDLFVYMQKTG